MGLVAEEVFQRRLPTNWRPFVECVTSLLRHTVWAGDQELAEIQMPGGSAPNEVALRENDTAATVLPLHCSPIHETRFGLFTDPLRARYCRGDPKPSAGARRDRVGVRMSVIEQRWDRRGRPLDPGRPDGH